MASLINNSSLTLKKSDQFVYWFGRHWVLTISFLFGLYVLTPFLAPVFMAAGLSFPGKAIYWFYSFFCHQLPQRSYFLFGDNISYNLSEIHSVWQDNGNILLLRQYIGNPQMGWKVAWSDRMVSMYTSIWIFIILWGSVKKKMKPLPWWGLALLIIPMAIDGTSHMLSDFAGIGQGFRDTNAWLAAITNNQFPVSFYAGDAWGSFNAWMRLISGVLFGLGIVWFSFPYLEDAFNNSVKVVEHKVQYQTLLKKEKDRLKKL
jgi:uncharacterized membrane protein